MVNIFIAGIIEAQAEGSVRRKFSMSITARKEVERERPYKILRRIGEVRRLVFNGKE